MTTQTAARRSPTARELGIWRDFVETGDALRSVLASRMQAESALSSGDYAVLLALVEAGESGLRSSDLAAHIGWERSRLSHHLGRMERRALIRRDECATDSRGAEVVVTPEGLDAFRRSNPSHLHAVREYFVDALTAEQLDQVAAITAALSAQLDRSRRG